MAPRPELHATLIAITPNVYFQPPPSVQMQYPCIVYSRDNLDIEHADNKPYKHKLRYQVTVIDRNPDSTLVMELAKLPTCSYERFFTADNLNHDVFRLSY
jgi:hypothetical protein